MNNSSIFSKLIDKSHSPTLLPLLPCTSPACSLHTLPLLCLELL